MARYVCQHCSKQIEAPESEAGAEMACPHCGEATLLVPVKNPLAKKPGLVLPPIAPPEKLSIKEVSGTAQHIIANIERVIFGKHEQVTLAVAVLLAEGHFLVEDVPGVAKTMLARAIAQSGGCTFKRIQCTPDLEPADILGVPYVDMESGRTEFRFGPLFSQFVLVDEINRASPRTQAAMLEAMGEASITEGRSTYQMARPFTVIATQNPIEQEGTFLLPEAQKDRFLVRMSLGYPALKDEKEMCERFQLRHPIETLKPVTTPDQILKCQEVVRDVRVDSEVCDYILSLVRATREHPALLLGASPRGSLGLFRLAQAMAAIRGNDSVAVEQVKGLAEAALAHRLIMKNERKDRYADSREVIKEIIAGAKAE